MLMHWTPFRELAGLQNEVNRIFDNITRGTGTAASTSSGLWSPPVDVYEDEGRFLIHAELPGLSKDDIELHLENRTLTIRGERKSSKDYQGENFHQRERIYGKFARSFTLPATVAQDQITANFKEGVLEVVLPKADEVKPKLIQVTSN